MHVVYCYYTTVICHAVPHNIQAHATNTSTHTTGEPKYTPHTYLDSMLGVPVRLAVANKVHPTRTRGECNSVDCSCHRDS
jgi:hypothetical protein